MYSCTWNTSVLFLHFYDAGSMASAELTVEEDFQQQALRLQHTSHALHLTTYCEECSLTNFVFPRRLGQLFLHAPLRMSDPTQ